ncbi:hypothetical protein F5I97DRAFT_1926985 [Phlebopus sp. FC_14]|nr:hypothetical protein F5I97DRAFT_1926985 [Phlebopus sp. FC_14]
MPAQTLVPGYKQVEEFGPDEDYVDEEEEVSYVTLDLGAVEPTLLPSSSTYRLIGLDTQTPFLQLSGSIFMGQHDTLLGTELLFTEEKNDTEPNRRSFAHVGSTEQRIRFKEVQLKKKTPAVTPSVHATPAEVIATEQDHSNTRSTSSDQPLERLTGHSSAAPTRTRKKGSRKGKEREVDPRDEDAMDTS